MSEARGVGERLSRVASFVKLNGYSRIRDLARLTGVSELTVRRDLKRLSQAGHLKLVPGGATAEAHAGSMIRFRQEVARMKAEKQAIAAAAAAMVREGDSVIFDGGTTTYYVAQALLGRKLSVVTNSIPVAEVFGLDSGTETMVLGGTYYPATGVMLGPLTARQLESMKVKLLFIGVAGVMRDGFYNSNHQLVETELAMMRAAQKVVVVADSSKFGKQALARLAPLKEADVVVTDSGVGGQQRQWLREEGCNLVMARPRPGGSGT